ncbi:MAG: hypothetical protein K2X43_19805, partial [Hyphomonadaceae bacterium]|nr:hypothetical protein [Hyphomonadaceae bacterium]
AEPVEARFGERSPSFDKAQDEGEPAAFPEAEPGARAEARLSGIFAPSLVGGRGPSFDEAQDEGGGCGPSFGKLRTQARALSSRVKLAPTPC